MVGRGELGFVQIQTTMAKGIISGPMAADAEGAIVWALLIASLVGPILFRLALKIKVRDSTSASESFILAYNSGEKNEVPADVEDGLPRLLANTTANDVGPSKKEKPTEAPVSNSVQA